MAAYGIKALVTANPKPQPGMIGHPLELDQVTNIVRGAGGVVEVLSDNQIEVTFNTQREWLAGMKFIWDYPGYFTLELTKIL